MEQHSFGSWLKLKRKALDLTREGLGERVGCSAATIRKIEAEERRPSEQIAYAVKKAVTVPVAVKLSPYFSSMANMANRLVNAGADGLVMFNRFYQPDINLEQLEGVPEVNLSDSSESRLPMRRIAILYGRVKASLAATSGIHSAADVLKVVMAGADVAMMCSALLKHGPDHVRHVLTDLREWMLEHEYVSIQQKKGSMSQKFVADPSAFERANYMKALNRYQLLV